MTPENREERGEEPETAFRELVQGTFRTLRDRLCDAFEALETEADDPVFSPGRFVRTPWDRPGGGGGVMSLMRDGALFEKVGVNVSTVHGIFPAEFRRKIPGAEGDGRFWASGLSVVAHMRSPMVPAVHMNVRRIETGKSWFGGGADMTPACPVEEDTACFHEALGRACDAFDPAWYPRFREACDRYFWLPHRNETRGVGGIFFDGHDSGDPFRDLEFCRAVTLAFLDSFLEIVRRRSRTPWGEAEREKLLRKRGRYVEFNLLYDRGTTFGLQTQGNVEAILMSLPPLASWP